MNIKPLIATILAGLMLSACASITRGTKEAFVIETNPPGAHAELSNGFDCTTPCSLRLPRRSNFVVTLTKDGYETVTANITNTTSGAGAAGMAGNVLVGGIIGIAVDAGTGATQDLTPNPLSVTMLPINEPVRMMEPVEDDVMEEIEEEMDEAEGMEDDAGV